MTVQCLAPWVNLHISTAEQVKPCCRGAGIEAAIPSISSYVQGTYPALEVLKQGLLSDEEPIACMGCQERNWYSEFEDATDTALKEPQLKLQSIDLRWSNLCQLTCLYCDGAFSSSWAAINTKTEQKKSYRISTDKSVLLEMVDRSKQTIKRVSLLGGEPLLIKENLMVLEMLRPDVKVDVFSGFNLDLDNNPIYQKLITMPNVQWSISMETLGDKFEFVRRNAQWSRQVHNLKKLQEQSSSKYTPSFQSQFCVYSATCIEDLYLLAADLGYTINWNWLSFPDQLDFSSFPDEHKIKALDQFENVKKLRHVDDCIPVVDHLVDNITASFGKGSWHSVKRCVEWHQQREHIYFQNDRNFLSLWPEFEHSTLGP